MKVLWTVYAEICSDHVSWGLHNLKTSEPALASRPITDWHWIFNLELELNLEFSIHNLHDNIGHIGPDLTACTNPSWCSKTNVRIHKRHEKYWKGVETVIFAADIIWYACIWRSLPFRRKSYWRRVYKLIMQGDLLRIAQVNLLVFGPSFAKKHVLNQTLICTHNFTLPSGLFWMCTLMLFALFSICTLWPDFTDGIFDTELTSRKPPLK